MSNQLRSSASPVAWMFAGVLLGSLFPLFVEFVPTHSVLLSAAGILLGQSVGVVIYIALFHRDLVADKALLRLFLLRALPWPFIGHAARVNDPRRPRTSTSPLPTITRSLGKSGAVHTAC